ncbi:hypothetical protein Tsubulata_016642 [Turnera subulata]|uniref:Uncharacterized protein n=1 Tax=Turnera subulata TaxID=218843 RepID=A0A9Q0FLZ4_9ROSI|nr:hypothetical protein Tsubulata_016642 [Turnera subulata]
MITLYHEAIDVEKYEDSDSDDIVILDELMDTKHKRKAVEDNFDGCYQLKSALPDHRFGSSPSNVINLDDPGADLPFHGGSASVDASAGDLVDFDYPLVQAYYESVDTPPGVEAPIPLLEDSVYHAKQVTEGSNSVKTGNQTHTAGLYSSKPSHVAQKLSSASSSSFLTPVKPLDSAIGVGSSTSVPLSQTSQVKQCRIAENSDDFMDFDDYAYLQAYFESANIPPGVEASIRTLQDFLANTNNSVHGSGTENISNQKPTDTDGVSRYSKPAHFDPPNSPKELYFSRGPVLFCASASNFQNNQNSKK